MPPATSRTKFHPIAGSDPLVDHRRRRRCKCEGLSNLCRGQFPLMRADQLWRRGELDNQVGTRQQSDDDTGEPLRSTKPHSLGLDKVTIHPPVANNEAIPPECWTDGIEVAQPAITTRPPPDAIAAVVIAGTSLLSGEEMTAHSGALSQPGGRFPCPIVHFIEVAMLRPALPRRSRCSLSYSR